MGNGGSTTQQGQAGIAPMETVHAWVGRGASKIGCLRSHHYLFWPSLDTTNTIFCISVFPVFLYSGRFRWKFEQDSGFCTHTNDLAVVDPSFLQLLEEAVDHDPEVDAERWNDSLSTFGRQNWFQIWAYTMPGRR